MPRRGTDAVYQRISLKCGEGHQPQSFWQGSNVTINWVCHSFCSALVPVLLGDKGKKQYVQHADCLPSVSPFTYSHFLWRRWQWKWFHGDDGIPQDLGDKRESITDTAFQLLKSRGTVLGVDDELTWQQELCLARTTFNRRVKHKPKVLSNGMLAEISLSY